MYTNSVAAHAAGIPIRAVRHICAAGHFAPDRQAGHWHRHSPVDVAVLAVAGRLTPHGFTPAEALSVAADALLPLRPGPGFELAVWLIRQLVAGWVLHVWRDANGCPAWRINPKGPADADTLVRVEVGTVITLSLNRLCEIRKQQP